MRKLASKFRDDVEDAVENIVTVRREDKTINDFTIEFENLNGPLITINNVELLNKNQQRIMAKLDLELRKKDRIILSGPN
jgi:ATPase subunit of ABC transporter with duplicated ATPase domains